MSVCSESLRPWCKKPAWLCASQSWGKETAEHCALTGHSVSERLCLEAVRPRASEEEACFLWPPHVRRFNPPLYLAEHSIFAVPGLLKADMFTWIHIPTVLPLQCPHPMQTSTTGYLLTRIHYTACFQLHYALYTIGETYSIWIEIE